MRFGSRKQAAVIDLTMHPKYVLKRSLGVQPDTRRSFRPKETRYERLVRLAFILRRIGVSEEQTARLIRQHDPETIERLLKKVPWRRARNQAAYLLSAIDNARRSKPRDGLTTEPVSRDR